MIDTEKCKECEYNPKGIFFPEIVVCHHPYFNDKNHCPKLRDRVELLLKQIREKPAGEITSIVREFIEEL